MSVNEILEFINESEDSVGTYPDLLDALIGYAYPWDTSGNRVCRLIYSAERIIKIFMERDGMTEEEALEFISYNTDGGYYGQSTPIIMYTNKKKRKESKMKKRKLSEQSCKSCKFYSSDLPLHGFCRCNPPVPVPDCNEDFDWLYPCTAHNDWCGKWEDIKATETK